MKSIYKYPFKWEHKPSLRMPKGAKILKFGVQDHLPTIWASVDVGETLGEDREFLMIGTGQTVPDLHACYLSYIDTVFTHDEKFVWHLFEVL